MKILNLPPKKWAVFQNDLELVVNMLKFLCFVNLVIIRCLRFLLFNSINISCIFISNKPHFCRF